MAESSPNEPLRDDPTRREPPQDEPRGDGPGRGLLIAMIVFGVLLVAAAIWITIGYETSDEHGAVEPAPESVEESPAFDDSDVIEPPAPERDETTAPTTPPPEGAPLGPPDPAVPEGEG